MAYDIDEILEINKFSHLDDGERIFFCKTDYVGQILPRLGELDREVILISGNSDYVINKERFKSKPRNVVKWFCQNKHFDSEALVPIPIGVENRTECKLGSGHGFVWGHAPEKHELISTAEEVVPTKMLYANYTLDNNRHPARFTWMSIAEGSSHITVEKEMNRPYREFISDVLDHEAVLCPLGNSPEEDAADNHRIYETLYLGRIPVLHIKDTYERLHHKFPAILIENIEVIADEDFMRGEIDRIKSQTYNKNHLKFSYWRDLILKEKEKLK
tara:strand:- start:393 stop:1211 length:819 start_codon:yes stop_codon:yes gene_type:complete